MTSSTASTKAQRCWKTLFTAKFPSIRLPIVGPPMIGVSGGHWAAAVQQAGGMGFIAAGHNSLENQDALAREIGLYGQSYYGNDNISEKKNDDEHEQQRQQQQRPFFLGLGFIGHSATTSRLDAWKRYEQVLDEYRPHMVQFFAPAITRHPHDPQKTNISLARDYGAQVMVQVGDVTSGKEALQHGVDCLVAQGAESGGHGLRPPLGRALIPLLTDLKAMTTVNSCDPYTGIPVLAAGGITTGAMAAAALCAGADGVVLGTRLWASHEALGHDTYKQALVETMSCDDVIRTTVVDQIQNHYVTDPWPEPYDSLGVLQNQVTARWEGKPVELANALGSLHCPSLRYRQASQEGDVHRGAVLSGQGVGRIQSIDKVMDIISRVEEEMIDSIQRLSGILNE